MLFKNKTYGDNNEDESYHSNPGLYFIRQSEPKGGEDCANQIDYLGGASLK